MTSTDLSLKGLSAEHLNELLVKVREATGPDRELDGEIDAVLRGGLPTLPEWAWANFPVWKHISNGRVCTLHDSGEHGLNWASNPYSASVDAALALVERVLPGWSIAHLSQQDDKSWFCELREGYITSYNRVAMSETMLGRRPANLPLAILTALLSALIASSTP